MEVAGAGGERAEGASEADVAGEEVAKTPEWAAEAPECAAVAEFLRDGVAAVAAEGAADAPEVATMVADWEDAAVECVAG